MAKVQLKHHRLSQRYGKEGFSLYHPAFLKSKSQSFIN
jgi:hypothetical protein